MLSATLRDVSAPIAAIRTSKNPLHPDWRVKCGVKRRSDKRRTPRTLSHRVLRRGGAEFRQVDALIPETSTARISCVDWDQVVDVGVLLGCAVPRVVKKPDGANLQRSAAVLNRELPLGFLCASHLLRGQEPQIPLRERFGHQGNVIVWVLQHSDRAVIRLIGDEKRNALFPRPRGLQR